MHSRRAILLASTALVGFGSLAFVQTPSLAAACSGTAGSGVVTCAGDTDTASDNPVIVSATNGSGDVAVTADTTSEIDTTTGGNLLIPATSNGTVSFVNHGQVGLAAGDPGVEIDGDPSAEDNNATVNNTSLINGVLIIGSSGSPVGGTGTVANTGTVVGNLSIFSIGNASLTSNGSDSLINGSVTLVSSDTTTTDETSGPSDNITTTTTLGGTATASVGDVGVEGDEDDVDELFNPDGFLGEDISLFGISGATLTISGHTGHAEAISSSEKTVVDVGDPDTDDDGVTTTTTSTVTSTVGGPVSGTVTSSGQVLGGLLLSSPGGVSATIAGTVVGTIGSGFGTALELYAGGDSTLIVEDSETTVVDEDDVVLSDITVHTETSGGSGATLTVDAGAHVDGDVEVLSDGNQTVTINGSIGRLDEDGDVAAEGNLILESASFTETTTDTTLQNNVSGSGVLASTSSLTTHTDMGGDINLTIGTSGAVQGEVDVTTGGGDLTVVVNGVLGNLDVPGTGLFANLFGSAFGFGTEITYDETGSFPVLRVDTFTSTAEGGAFSMAVNAGGVVNGDVVVFTNADPALTVDGTINGSVSIDALATDFQSTTTQTFDPDDGDLLTYVNTTSTTDVSEPITVTIGTSGKLLGDLVLATGADVNVTVNGTLGSGAESAEALNIFTRATDETTSDTRAYDDDGATIISRQLTNHQSASGGAANVTIGVGAVVSGNVVVTADGAISFINNGSIHRQPTGALGAGNVSLTSSRSLTTVSDSSPIANNITTTTADDDTSVEVKHTGSSTTTTQTVGGTVNFVNTSVKSVDGSLTILALGDITISDPGLIVGNVTATSTGTTSTTTTNGLTDDLQLFQDDDNPGVLTQQTITTKPTATNFNTVTSNIGGSVTGTYGGFVGLDNQAIDTLAILETAGTTLTQTADKNSTITIPSTGTVFENVNSIAGVGAGTTTSSSTQTVVDVLNSDSSSGSAEFTDGTVTVDTAKTGAATGLGANFTPAAGATSKIDIAGIVAKLATNAVPTVTATGTFGATVNVSGSTQGNVFANSLTAATSSSDTVHQTFSLDEDGLPTETAFSETSVVTQTGMGGAAAISLTGKNGVLGAFANGTTGATVTVDAASKVTTNGVTATLGVVRDTSNTTTTTRVYSGTKFTQTIANSQTNGPAAAASKATALVTINGPATGNVAAVAGDAVPGAFGTFGATANTAGNATGTIANVVTGNVTVQANANKMSQSSTKVQTGKASATGAILGLPTVPVTPAIGSTTIPAASLGSILASSFTGSGTTQSSGGVASATLTAPAATAASAAVLVTGTVAVSGDTSATLTVNAGARIAGTTTVTSTPMTVVDGLAGLSSFAKSTTETFNSKGNLTGRTLVQSTTPTGGIASYTNSGEQRGAVTITSGGTSTLVNNATGIFGNFTPGNSALTAPFFSGAGTTVITSIQNGTSTTTTDTGLVDPITGDPITGTSTVVVAPIVALGTTTVTNSGIFWGGLTASGGTTTITNNATGAIGTTGSGITVGAPAGFSTVTTVTTATSTVKTTTAPNPLFNQTITVNQSGVLLNGVTVNGPNGTDGNVTSVIKATVNLNDGSISLGSSGVAVGVGAATGGTLSPVVVGNMGTSSNPAAFNTTTNVNLSGNNFIGANSPAFRAAKLPPLTTGQLQSLAQFFGAGTNPVSIAAGTIGLFNGGSITGVTALTRNAGGTTFFTGVPYNNNNTSQLTDDVYSIRVTTFTVASGGEMQFALDNFDPTSSAAVTGSTTAIALPATGILGALAGGVNLPQPVNNIFGISGAVTNNGTFVLGARASQISPPNFGSLTNSAPQYIEGLNFRIDGSFTQSSTGTLVTGAVPSLVRVAALPVSFGLQDDLLGVLRVPLITTLFTIPSKSAILTSTPSFVQVNGTLTLGGSVVVAVDRNALYANNVSAPLFVATGTTTLNATTVTTTIPSPFVSFVLTSSTSSGVTTVSLVSQRKSFGTVTTSNNAGEAARALDSDVSGIIPRIISDANGGAVFANIQEGANVQDLANIVSMLDFVIPAGTAPAVFDDLSSGSFYGSLRAFDRTRVLRDGFDGVVAGATTMDKPGITIWGNPIFRSTRLDGNSDVGTGDINSDEGGITVGSDFRFSQSVGVGIAGGYTNARIKDKDPASADVNTWLIGVNAYYLTGPVHVGGQVAFGRSEYKVDRPMPTMGREAHAKFGGEEWRAQLEAGYSFYMTAADGSLTPYVAVDMRRSEIHGFTETDAGGVSLDVTGRADTTTNPRLGLRWMGSTWSSAIFRVVPQVEGSYTFNNDMDTTTTATFVGGTSPFTTQGIAGRGYGTIQAGLFGSIGETGSIGLVGAYDFAGKTTATSIAAKLQFRM